YIVPESASFRRTAAGKRTKNCLTGKKKEYTKGKYSALARRNLPFALPRQLAGAAHGAVARRV
ncbi:MAG: hypothetical protein AAB803_00980, partial [Patescibacteria group bacterium]